MTLPKTCSLVFLRRDDEILLAMKKRGFGQGYWNGLGGKIAPGETIEQAMVREAEEEAGVTPLAYTKVAVHDFIMDETGAEPWHMHVHAYVCDKWDGEPVETDEMAPRWFKLNEIPYKQMWQDDVVWLPLILDGKRLRTTFGFDADDEILNAHIDIVPDLT